MTETYDIHSTKNYQEFRKYVSSTDTFSEIGLALPLVFYKLAPGDQVCPVKKKGHRVTGIFSTGSDAAAKIFTDSIKERKTFPKVKNGLYLFDYKNGKVIYDFSTKKLINEHDWVYIAEPFDKSDFGHIIAKDTLGNIHKMWHKTAPFADSCYLAHLINGFFSAGEYKPHIKGVDTVFKILASRYGMVAPTARNIGAFINHSFEPYAPAIPEQTISTFMLELIFNPDETVLSDLSCENNIPYDHEFFPQQGYWEEDLTKVGLLELVGATNLPRVDVDVDVYLDMNLVGLNKVILTPEGRLLVHYDSTKITYHSLSETLVLPTSVTYYIDDTRKEVI